MRVAFLGFGLIGGSVARALRISEPAGGRPWSVAAWTPSGDGPRAGVRAGVVDVAAPNAEAAIDGADIIVLAAPVPDCLSMLDDLAGPWRSVLDDAAVITDVASTKSGLVLRATALGLRFVGGHPMAGRETSGFGASDADLFRDRPWVVVPTTDDGAVARVEELARAVGATPMRMGAGLHDQAVAAISHLPLIVAASLVESVAGGDVGPRDDWGTAVALAAGGWLDTTRVARGDVAMGTGIIVTNAEAIAPRVRAMIDTLEAWLAELERPGGPDPTAVEARLRLARERLPGVAR
jgi:prephenate dehydrogenase